MDFSAAVSWITIPIQIFCLDVLLGADNALVIAMACRSLRPDDTRKAILFGTGGAVLFRFLMTIAAGSLLTAPFLKLGGALVLLVIAVNLIAQDEAGELNGLANATPSRPSVRGSLWSAALLIVVVDATMSLDNVVALAAIARGNIWLLAAGVLFSIPVLVSGSLILANLLQSYPALVTAGCGVLGWVAGDMAIADPAIADWANARAPALVLMAPVLGAAYVLVQARFMAQDRQSSAKANVAHAPRSAQKARRPFPARALLSSASADRLSKTSGRLEPAGRETRAAPSAFDSPSERRRAAAGLARPRNGREERIVMIGLILLAALAGGMIALVAYLDNLHMQ
jgi:YjbE family integral membrane protein